MNKRGQFFILTAVIVAALIFSISTTVNKVNTFREFNKIRDYSNMINKELALVQNYQVYTGIENDELEDFINVVAVTLKDQDPGINFAILYGNKNSITIKNYGKNGILVNNNIIPGTLDNEGIIVLETGTLKTSTIIGGEVIILNPDDKTEIQFEKNTYFFTIPEHNVVVFLMEKGDGDEKFITIK